MFQVASGVVGHGVIGIDALGFQDQRCTELCARRDMSMSRFIGAHAPSSVVIDLEQPAMLWGFLNASAMLDRANPVEFWCDWNYIGQVVTPTAVTAMRYLPPGRHHLVTRHLGAHHSTRHSIWGFTPTDARPEPKSACLTLGAYNERFIPGQLAIAAYSAAKQGIWLDVKAIGHAYHTHYHSKVVRMLRYVQQLPAAVDFVVYADGRDSLYLATMEEIRDRFEALDKPLVVGAEARCFNVEAWAPRFPGQPFGHNYICAGVWMGWRDAVIDALTRLVELFERAERDDTTGLVAYWPWRDHFDNDQTLWHIAYLEKMFPIHLDDKFELIASVAMDPHRLDSPAFDFTGKRLRYTRTNCEPCIAHFSAANDWRDAWAGMLDCI